MAIFFPRQKRSNALYWSSSVLLKMHENQQRVLFTKLNLRSDSSIWACRIWGPHAVPFDFVIHGSLQAFFFPKTCWRCMSVTAWNSLWLNRALTRLIVTLKNTKLFCRAEWACLSYPMTLTQQQPCHAVLICKSHSAPHPSRITYRVSVKNASHIDQSAAAVNWFMLKTWCK